MRPAGSAAAAAASRWRERDERNAERAAGTQNELAALREDVRILTKAVEQSAKKQKALDGPSGEPVQAIGVVADFDDGQPQYEPKNLFPAARKSKFHFTAP